MPSLKLWWNPVSQPSRATYWAIVANGNIKDVDCTVLDIFKGENRTPEFLAVNPFHTVPTLKDEENGLVLTESAAIMQYLAEKFKWTKITIPKDDLVTRANVFNYLHWHHSHVRAMRDQILFPYAMPPLAGGKPDMEGVKAGVAKAKEWLSSFDKSIVANGGYVAGKYMTVADLQAFCELIQYPSGEYGFGLLDYDEYPNIKAWMEKVKQEPHFEELHKPYLGFVHMVKAAAGEVPK